MAVWINWSEEQKKMWDDWMTERPDCITEMAKKYGLRADKLYRLTTTNQRVVLVSFSENGTVTVGVYKDFNMFPAGDLQARTVFGIKPSDLEECDYPTEDEVWEGHWHPVLEGSKGQTLNDY